MKNILYLFCFLLTNQLCAQTAQEQEIIKAIKVIDQQLSEDPSTLKPALAQFKKLAQKHKKEATLAAISNALIGEKLAQKKHYNEAKKFCKTAYKARKKEGKLLPQRWTLKALMNIANQQNDIKNLYNYSKEWMALTNKYLTQLDTYYIKTAYYQTPWTKEYIIRYELRTLARNLRKILSSGEDASNKDRRKYSIAFFKYALENFAPYQEAFLIDFRESFEYMIPNSASNQDGAAALSDAKEILKIMASHCSLETQASFARLFATMLRKSQDRYFNKIKTTKYEVLGIELMLDYIKICEQLDDKAAILFAYRYIGTRYAVLEDYQKAVQYLATSIKKSRAYKMDDQVKYGLGGIQSMYFSIAANKTAIEAAKTWENNYSMEGLTADDIQYIGFILAGL